MKYFLPLVFSLLIFASCSQSNQKSADRQIELIVDSLAFKNNNIYTDTLVQAESEKPKEIARTPVKAVAKPKPVVVKSQPVKKQPAVQIKPTEEPVSTQPPVAQVPEQAETGSIGGGNSESKGDVPGTVQTEQKKGWSKAAQGAVIGGASGAVAGAIISKKKGVGAVVGGVVGAAGGYIIGKQKDKKDKP